MRCAGAEGKMASRAFELLPRPVRRLIRRNERSAWKGLLAGAVGGLVGTIAMTEFQKGWQKVAEKRRSGDRPREQKTSRARSSEEKEEGPMTAAGRRAQALD